MIYTLVIVAVITVSGVLLSARMGGRGDKQTKAPIHRAEPDSMGSLSMGEIYVLLERLESEDPPERVMGAMCYEAMAYPDVAEYICPVCGEKTVYEDGLTGFIEWELTSCRRLALSIDGLTEFDVSLDETLYCDFCSSRPEDDPELFLRVASGSSSETVSLVTVTDLRRLDSFLRGRLYYESEFGEQIPLLESAGRLRQLLGIQEDQ